MESIEKKLIYGKAVPVNTREMTKNLGVIKTNKKSKNSVLETNKLVDSDAYALYRNIFRINMKDGVEDFTYKIKFLFTEE